jgi:hypothetical protein
MLGIIDSLNLALPVKQYLKPLPFSASGMESIMVNAGVLGRPST